jgi:hypothetical protein
MRAEGGGTENAEHKSGKERRRAERRREQRSREERKDEIKEREKRGWCDLNRLGAQAVQLAVRVQLQRVEPQSR